MSNFYGGDHDDVEKGDSLQCRASLTGGGGRGRCLLCQVMLGLPQYASFALQFSTLWNSPAFSGKRSFFLSILVPFSPCLGARAHSPTSLCNVGERSHDELS